MGAETPETTPEQLRHAMESRVLMNQACGVLMASHGCTPEQSWTVLKAVSQDTNTEIHMVAEQVTAATQTAWMAEPVGPALRAELRALE